MRIYKPYLLMALTLPFLSVSCQPQVESAKIVTIDKVGAIAMPEEIAPIGKIPFQMPDLKRPVFPELTATYQIREPKQMNLSLLLSIKRSWTFTIEGGGLSSSPKGNGNQGVLC